MDRDGSSTEETPALPAQGWTDRGPGTAMLAVVALGFAALTLQCCAGCPLGVLDGVLRSSMGYQGSLVTHPLALAFTSVAALGITTGLGMLLARGYRRELLPLKGFHPLLLPALVPAVIGTSIALMELGTVQEMVMPMPSLLVDFFEDAFAGGQSSIGSWVLAVAVAPVMEELLFRGVMLRGLLRRWPGPHAVLLTALIFALFHANPWQFVAPLVLGLFFGWLTLRSGSLWPAIFAHALNNATALTAMALLRDGDAVQAAAGPGPSFGPLWLDLLGIACLAVGVPACLWVLRKRPPPG
jgi:membrane protease YdiL (CAAX protease family)